MTTIDRGVIPAAYHRPRPAGPLELFVSPIRRWRFLASLALITAVVSAVVSFIVPSRFTASTSFIADQGNQGNLPASLAGLASQFGLSEALGQSSGPQFYADLVRSRAILRALLVSRVPSDGRQVAVIDLLGTTDDNPNRRLELATRTMTDRIDVSFDRTTQRVDLSVWMRRPETAKAVADTLLALVDRFDRDIRRTRAGDKQLFAEQQRQLAADSLRLAERDMETFLERNRAYQSSAQLQFEHDRLQRVISLRQELYLALAREAAEARIDAVDTRPVLTVIDPPVLPAIRTSPKRKLFVLVSVVVVVAFAWLALVARQLATAVMADGESDVARAAHVVRGALRASKDRDGIDDIPGGG